jgi:Mn-dependent DtxR family transcriptional regulator
LRDSKKRLLQEINKGNIKVEELTKKLKIKQSAVYQHIQELKREGYVENDIGLKLTDLGRIMIL